MQKSQTSSANVKNKQVGHVRTNNMWLLKLKLKDQCVTVKGIYRHDIVGKKKHKIILIR